MADIEMVFVPSYQSFSATARNVTTDRTVEVSNSGDASNLIIGTMSGLVAPFSVVDDNVSDATIAPDGTETFVLRYTPTALGTFSDTLVVPSNDTTANFLVDGTCQEADMTVSPAYKYFGVTEKTATDQTITFSNGGNIGLVVSGLTGLAAPFSLVNDNVTDATINAGDSSTVVLRFNPTTLGTFSDTLVIASNDADAPSVNFLTDGTAAQADISLSPTSKNFGNVYIGSTSDQVVTVNNIGTVALVVSAVSPLSAPFSVVTDNVTDATINAGDSSTLTVRFAPTADAPYSGTLTLTSDDPDTPSISFGVFGKGEEQRFSSSDYPTGRSNRGLPRINTIWDHIGDRH